MSTDDSTSGMEDAAALRAQIEAMGAAMREALGSRAKLLAFPSGLNAKQIIARQHVLAAYQALDAIADGLLSAEALARDEVLLSPIRASAR